MPLNLNKAIIAGKLGRDPEIRTFSNGNKVASFSVATSERWTDKASGERKEKTQWHRIAIFDMRLVDLAEKYLHKGSSVYLEGSIETRTYTDKDGAEKSITEIVLQKYKGEMHFMDTPKDKPNGSAAKPEAKAPPTRDEFGSNDLDDEIPF